MARGSSIQTVSGEPARDDSQSNGPGKHGGIHSNCRLCLWFQVERPGHSTPKLASLEASAAPITYQEWCVPRLPG